jgi:O-antigen ligase
VGALSTIALLVVSIFHSQFNFDRFRTLLRFYVVGIELVALAGIAQFYNYIELPGASGVGSTLGNTDFYAALIGTAFPLILFLALDASRRIQIAYAGFSLINLYALKLAGPIQGFLDVIAAVVGLSILLFRRFIPRREISLNARTFLGTFAVIIWAEFIFLMPFLGHFVPVLGNDMQVKIRANFWLAGMRQFFSHPLFGVGPDQYGNNYEQYRTLDDVKQFTNILSNDAHSASVQTLATLGIVATLIFVALIGLVIRSILILWDSKKIDRKALFALSLFVFVYLTNSFVSPITLSHKYIFWSTCGFLVGQAYRMPSRISLKSASIKYSAVALALVSVLVAFNFAQGQLNWLTHIEKYAANNSVVLDYEASPLLPCFMYFEAEMLMAANHGNDYSVAFAQEELKSNPRCVAAEIFLAKTAVNLDRIPALKPHIYRLLDLAPYRQDTLSIGMFYANRSGDVRVRTVVEARMKELGLVYIPGKLG